MVSWKELHGPALSIGRAISQAVDAAGNRDRAAYESAAVDVALLAAEPLGGHAYGSGSTGTVSTQVPTAAGYAWHAPLLIADLLAAGQRPLGGYLDAAFTEIARAETMEMP